MAAMSRMAPHKSQPSPWAVGLFVISLTFGAFALALFAITDFPPI